MLERENMCAHLLSSVTSEESKNENKSSECGQWDGVSRHGDGLAVLVEAADAGAHQDAADKSANG